MSDTKTRDMILSKLKAGLITYNEFDISGRVSAVYEAPIYAKTGDPCLVTELKYTGTSSAVTATKEYVGVWDDAYHFDNL